MNYLIVWLLLISSTAMANPWSFNFNDSLQGWGSWGDGLAVIDNAQGFREKGSVRLSTDYSNTQTIHFETEKLTGTYHISFYVRAENVLSDERNFSFWHFLDKGQGTENIFTNLFGSYEWRKVEYTVTVNDHKLLIWFRLKSTGKVWVDDLKIEKTSRETPLGIAKAIPLKTPTPVLQGVSSIGQKKILLDFEKLASPHPFVINLVNNSRMGKMKLHEFYNLEPLNYEQGNWENFDYINLEIYNPNDEAVLFTMALGDYRSTDYWTQLNHKSSLAPGVNKLSFPLRQFIGERGSHRYRRYLDLKSIKKWFLILDPNETKSNLKEFWLDNISLEKREILNRPVGVWSYDFTSQNNDVPSNSIRVLSHDLFTPSRGFGFVNPEFWRVEDAVYAPSDLRYTIGITKGSFRVRLPNGKYTLFLNVERLGYWDVSFWSNREIYLNQKIVFKEARSNTQDFLDDYLLFSNVAPEGEDNPYDLYLSKVFKYLNFDVEVKNGELDIGFIADATGISLNHLIIASLDKKGKAQEYLASLRSARKREFNRISRKVSPPAFTGEAQTKLISLKQALREDQTYKESAKSISWLGVKGETLYQIIEVRGEGDVSLKVTGRDEKFFQDNLKIFEIVPQIISLDLNHETYFYAGKFLKPFTKLSLKKGRAKFIMVEIEHSSSVAAKFISTFEVKVGKQTSIFPIELKALPFDLPRIDFPVGFFGPQPLQLNYANSEGVEKAKEDYRFLAIKKLADAGFTTFTSLPSDISSLTRLVHFANSAGMSGTYFSYGGDFPGDLLEKGEAYLYSVLDKINAKLVYTFSDEPGGYSNRIAEDLEKAKQLKKETPILLRGGFTNLNDKSLNELNSYFDYPFYSHMKGVVPVKGWGAYNAAPGTLDDPRFSLSAGLYYARKRGLTHYLEWHSSAIHNFPYYDLDGRESDIELFMAAPNKTLYPTMKFIKARQGIQVFRKIQLLQELTAKQTGNPSRKFLQRIEHGSFSDRQSILTPSKEFDFERFHGELNHSLENLK